MLKEGRSHGEARRHGEGAPESARPDGFDADTAQREALEEAALHPRPVAPNGQRIHRLGFRLAHAQPPQKLRRLHLNSLSPFSFLLSQLQPGPFYSPLQAHLSISYSQHQLNNLSCGCTTVSTSTTTSLSSFRVRKQNWNEASQETDPEIHT